jgi:hypothetical protein
MEGLEDHSTDSGLGDFAEVNNHLYFIDTRRTGPTCRDRFVERFILVLGF